MKVILGVFIAILFLVLAAPLFQLGFEPLPRRSVSGLKAPKKPPAFSAKSIFSGDFQKKAEDWFLKKHGLWGYLVRADNQIKYTLFGQISSNYGTPLLVARDNYLFQSFYLNAFNKFAAPEPEFLEDLVRRMKKLQLLLAQRGVGMLFLISTNKIELYPELVQGHYRDPSREQRKNAYDIMRPLLDKHGVHYLDAHQYFWRRKNTFPFLFFTTTSSHWNDVGACMITNELVSRIEELIGKKLIHFTCQPIKIKKKPRANDWDLGGISNLWSASVTQLPTPYPVTKTLRQGDEYQPSILFVGTSFVWSVLKFLDYHKVCRESNFYYYFRRRRHYPSAAEVPLRKESIDWEKNILSNDMVVFEVNEAVIESVGHGFIDDALKQIAKISVQ